MISTSISMGGRLAAPLLVSGALLLGGCSALEQGQLGQTASAVFGSDQFDAERARALPYASLRLRYDGNTGMVVLASLETVSSRPPSATDASPTQADHELPSPAASSSSATSAETVTTPSSPPTELARFETADHAFVRLENGWLTGTAGFGSDLLDMHRETRLTTLMSALAAGEPAPGYHVRTRWQRADGTEGYAQGRANWSCASPSVQPLPLGEQHVARCEESIHWSDGTLSVNHYAVAPAMAPDASPRIWAAEVQAWPDSPLWRWEVARAWW